MSARCDGCIRIEECSFHKEVVWDFDYPRRDVHSPIFVDGHQKYALRFYKRFGLLFEEFSIDLYRMGPSCESSEGSVSWWAGLKRRNGAYYHRIRSGSLDLTTECSSLDLKTECGSQNLKTESWIFQRAVDLMLVEEREVENQDLATEGRLTFFLRLSAKTDPRVPQTCVHSTSEMSAWADSSVLKSACPLHTEVQWNVSLEWSLPSDCYFWSPWFVIGNQRYRLELVSISHERMELMLYRLGPSEKGASKSVEWWAGLKRNDGFRYHRNVSGQLDLTAECRDMQQMVTLKRFATDEVHRLRRREGGEMTVFFLLSGGQTSTAADVCTHGAAYLLARNDGVMREEDCPSHREVEWHVYYRLAVQEGRNLASPVFVVGSQQYLLELSLIGDLCLSLSLFRMGPSAGSVRWWAGLKRGDGTCYSRIESKKLDLKRNCEMWTEVGGLKTVILSELDAENLAPAGCVTFFLCMSGEKSSDLCNHDGVVVPTRGEGILRNEEGSSYTHVEWEFEHQEHRSVTSPEFGIENQRFFLELSGDLESISLHLYRKGPSCIEKRSMLNNLKIPQRNVRCWAGLKRSDGSYYHRNLRGKVKVHKERKIWTRERLLYTYTPFEVKRKLLMPCGKLVAFFRLTLRGSSDEFDLGPPNLPSQGDGSIRVVEGTSCKEVAWTVQPDERWSTASAEFTFEDQRFLFELSLESREYARLTLFRAGRYGSVRWWAGLKRADGSYYHRTEAGKLEVWGYKMWRREQLLKEVALSELETHHLMLDGKLTFFVLFTEATTESPFLGFAELSAEGAGPIREEECSTHKEVEWQTHAIPQEGSWTLSSPEFEIGGQRYLLELSRASYFVLDLYRMGPSVDGPERFWAGLKVDGAYHHWNERGMLDLKENCVVWKKVKILCSFLDHYLHRKYFLPSSRVTLFFRLGVERPSTGLGVCIHGSSGASTWDDGRILEEECPSHKYVEWEFTWELKTIWTSPSFGIGRQRYLLELRRTVFDPQMKLELFRMGPFVDGSVRWWVGMNCDHWPESGKVDLGEECEVWRKVALLKVVHQRKLESYGRVTFSLLFSLLQSSTSLAEACSHVSRMVSKPRAGSITEEAWPSYKLVEWDIGCELTQAQDKILTSPDFFIGNHRFVLDLWCGKEYKSVQVFLMGPSEDRSAPWILGAKDHAGTYDESKCGKLDLEEAYEIWSKVEHVHLHGTFEPVKRNHLTISFLMSLDQTPTATLVGKNDVEALQNSQSLGQEDVVFEVQGKEFKVHRAVIRIRVPVLDAMLKYDTLEKRTGVVQIKDCDPAVFEIFLKYIVTGELQALPTDEDFALYALADKYLMKEFRLLCLRRIEESLSADSFCDVIELIFRYGDDDLLKIASKFLARNKDIVQSDIWQNFKSEYPNAASNLETEAFQHGS